MHLDAFKVNFKLAFGIPFPIVRRKKNQFQFLQPKGLQLCSTVSFPILQLCKNSTEEI